MKPIYSGTLFSVFFSFFSGLSLLFIAPFAIAQRPVIYPLAKGDVSVTLQATPPGCLHTDSIYYDRATGAEIVAEGSGGWIFGTNNYMDEFGQQFDLTTTGYTRVTEVFFWCGRKQIVGPADTLILKLYEVNLATDTLPAAAPIAWGQVSTSNVLVGAVNPAWTYVQINMGDNHVTTDYLVAFDVSTLNDTLGIASTSSQAGNGQLEQRIKVKSKPAFGGGWLTALNWVGLNSDLFILPILDTCGVVGDVDPSWSVGPLTLRPAWPNPANEAINIGFELKTAELGRVVIFDLSGKVILDSGEKRLEPGLHCETFDLKGLSAGTYFYTVSAGSAYLSGKFSTPAQ